MITFYNIEIEGFASIVKPFFYRFDLRGVNAIIAPNGTGKSTIFNALSWALYGKLLKPGSQVEPWPEVQGKDYKGTKVVVRFGNIILCRCVNYKGTTFGGRKGGTGIHIWNCGHYVERHKKKAEIQKYIDTVLLGMSFDLFKNTLMFGQDLTRFIRETGPRQKGLLDEAFDIDFINKGRELARAKMDEITTQLMTQEHAVELLESKIEGSDILIQTLKEQKAQKLREFDARIKEIREGLKKSTKERERYTEQKKKIKLLSEQISLKTSKLDPSLDSEKFKIDFELSNLADGEYAELKRKQKESRAILAKPVLKCTKCGQTINKDLQDAQRKEIKLAITSRDEQIVSLWKRMESLQIKLGQLSSKIKKQDALKKIIKSLNAKLEDLKNSSTEYFPGKEKAQKIELNALINQRRDTVGEEPWVDTLVQKARWEQELEAQRDIAKKLKKSSKRHKWIVDEALSNKGIKAYIFESMLQVLNVQLNKYSKWGWQVEFTVDLDSGNKSIFIIVKFGDNKKLYSELSGGEKQLVDIAIAFAMHDILAEKRFNILLMDEVFESLDKNNIQLLSELINKKAEGTSIHLVTHRSEFVTSSVRAIYLKKTSSGTIGLVQ